MAIVYRHIRKDTNEVFYIGIGKTIKRMISKNYRNKHWHNIVNKTEYYGEIIFDGISWEEAQIKERELIKKYGRRDLNEGTLVNMTDGGEGTSGYIHTEEWKLQNSIKSKGKIIPEYQKEAVKKYMSNRLITEDFKRKVSEGVKKYYDNVGRKEKKKCKKEPLIWVTKNNINKRTCQSYIEDLFKDGWALGRNISIDISHKISHKGSVWMNNGFKDSMIQKDNVQNYINMGWSRGRLSNRKNAL
jgi:hypothetical protein